VRERRLDVSVEFVFQLPLLPSFIFDW